ncbi:MAG: ATP-binding cassette domain-containing protein [Promethearchaeota archaeon]
MIKIENLTKKYGNLLAVDNISLEIKEGEVFGLLGPNGAGKTTIIRMLCCLISKTSGNAIIDDLSLDNKKDHLAIRKIIGILPENVGLYEDMTAYKNLNFIAKLYQYPENKRKERIEYYLKMLDLWDRKDKVAGTFSKGMKQKLAIARALIHEPKILFLDEPTANLDPEASKMVRDFILELKKENRTIFLNTHMLDEAERICDRVGILKTQLIDIGTTTELRQSLWGKKSIVEVDAVTDKILENIKSLGFGTITIDNNKMTIDVNDPHHDNPSIIRAIQDAGGQVQFVSELVPSLEDIYLKKIRRNE